MGSNAQLPAIRRGRYARPRVICSADALEGWDAIPGVDPKTWRMPCDVARAFARINPDARWENATLPTDRVARAERVRAALKDSVLRKQLWDYQAEDAPRLSESEYDVLGYEMSLGKSPLSAWTADKVAASNEHIVILCPGEMITDWTAWVKRIGNATPQVLRGRKVDAQIQSRWIIASYGVLQAQRTRTNAGKCVVIQNQYGFWCFAWGEMVGIPPDRIGPYPSIKIATGVAQTWLVKNLKLNWTDVAVPYTATDMIVAFAPVPSKDKVDRTDLPGWADEINRAKPAVVIVDEIHDLRGRKALRTKAVKLATRNALYVWGLTGTPMANRPRDMWAMLDILSGGQWGSSYQYVVRYAGAKPTPFGGLDTRGATNQEELKLRLSEVMIQRSVEGVKLQLPPRIRSIHVVETERSTSWEDDEDVKRLLQDQQRKAFRIKRDPLSEDVLNRMSQGQRVIVFVCYREHVGDLQARISKKAPAGSRIWGAHGEHSGEARGVVCEEFRAHQGPGALIATVQSLGKGVSLVGARTLIWGDIPMEPHYIVQGGRRAHRPPATQGLHEIFYCAERTVDESICDEVVERLDHWEAVLGLSAGTEDLRETLGGEDRQKRIYDDIYDAFVARIGRRAA